MTSLDHLFGELRKFIRNSHDNFHKFIQFISFWGQLWLDHSRESFLCTVFYSPEAPDWNGFVGQWFSRPIGWFRCDYERFMDHIRPVELWSCPSNQYQSMLCVCVRVNRHSSNQIHGFHLSFRLMRRVSSSLTTFQHQKKTSRHSLSLSMYTHLILFRDTQTSSCEKSSSVA